MKWVIRAAWTIVVADVLDGMRTEQSLAEADTETRDAIETSPVLFTPTWGGRSRATELRANEVLSPRRLRQRVLDMIWAGAHRV